jgi:integrase
VAEIDFTDVDALHRKITNQGARKKGRGSPYTANRVMAIVSKMFALAIKWKMRSPADGNPVKGLERNAEVKRRRYLDGPELAALLAALGERDEAARLRGHRSDRTSDVARLLLLTGARRGELLTARWGQFNLRGGTWTKPASMTKQRAEHTIPLSAPARQLLAEMRARLPRPPGDGELVFPSRRGATQTEIKNSWTKITERASVIWFAARPEEPDGELVADLARSLGRDPTLRETEDAAEAIGIELPVGLRDLRVHDLRHSYASFLASAGLSLPTIGALLGHSQPATTARYAHLLDDPLRQATERVGQIVAPTAKGTGTPTAEVMPLKGGA